MLYAIVIWQEKTDKYSKEMKIGLTNNPRRYLEGLSDLEYTNYDAMNNTWRYKFNNREEVYVIRPYNPWYFYCEDIYQMVEEA